MLEKNRKAIEEIVKECDDYMSTESGKNNILNPKDRIPIDKVNWFANDFSKEIKLRVDLYVENYLQTDAVLDRFENIKLEIFSFHNRVASRVFEMEKEWMNNASFVQGDGSNTHPSLLVFATGFFLTSLVVYGLGCSVFVATTCGVVISLLNIGIRTPTEIKKEYESCKKTVLKELFSHLENGYGRITKKMIEKITEKIIPKRMSSLKMRISQTSAKRDIYIANRVSLTNLNVILNKMIAKLKKLEKDVDNLI